MSCGRAVAAAPGGRFYRAVGDVMLIGTFGPEASVDPRGFEAAWRRAEERIEAYEPPRKEPQDGEANEMGHQR